MEKKHGPWTIKSSERVYKDEFVEFWVDECVKPDGEPGRRATLRMLPGVAVLPADEEGFVYMIRKFRYAVGKESVEVVQGAIDEGESAEEAARRELKEELGIEAREVTDLGPVDAVTSQVFSPSRLFLARGLKFGEPDREGTEVLQPLKLKLQEAVRMVTDGEITQSTTCVLVLKASRLIEGNSQ
ncbi:MAG: NUDIX hydrolase [Acidobacteriota bacterium]|nr:NUDIX hydrolase [Acidobacteriota bacterium]